MARSISRLFAASLVLACALGYAQGYPSKTVKIVIPAQPGGGLDLVGRTIADALGRALGASVIVENLSGGGGSIAARSVASAAPDGHTLMVGYVGTHGTNPAVRKVPYDAIRDFTAIAMVGTTPNVLVVHPAVPVQDLRGLVAFAKQSKLDYASGGIGTLNHLAMEQFRAAAGFEMVTVHYRGIGPAINDLRAGQVQTMMPGLAAARPHIVSGRMRPLAVTGLKRHALLPEVPTFEESGYQGFDGAQWYGIVGPAGLPAGITQKLNAQINQALASPALRARFSGEAIDPLPMAPAQFAAFIQAEIAKWAALARERGLVLE